MSQHHLYPWRSTMAPSRPLCIGMDGHKAPSAGAYIAQAHGADVTSLGTMGTRQGDIAHRIRTRQSQATHRILVSEAGPCGSWLWRYLRHKDDDCGVVAPSRMPHKAGDRLKTDRRDARPLARLARSGARTAVSGPTVDEEAMRDLPRVRAETRSDRKAATFRLQAVWRSHASRSPGRATWSPAHRRWRSAVVGPTPAPHSVLQA
jgi:transposase